MQTYTDYDFYKDTYKGNMPESDFDKLVIRASYEVRKNIFNRLIKGFEEEVQLATCSVADLLYKIEQLETKKQTTMSEKRLKSESVANYSRTFETTDMTDIDVQISNQRNKIIEEIRMYLLDTGLLYRGV